MDKRQPDAVYRVSGGMSWIVQDRGVQVIDELSRRSMTLSYPDAALWDLLLRGHGLARAASMLRWVLGVTEQEAQAHAARCTQQWLAAGLIVAAHPEAMGQP